MANFRKKFKNKIFPQKSFTSTLRLHVAVTYAKTPKNYILWLLIKLEKPHFGPILSTLNGNFYKKNLALLLFKGRWNSNYMQNIRKFLNETPQKKRVFRRISTSLVKKYFYRNRSRNWISPIFFIAKKKMLVLFQYMKPDRLKEINLYMVTITYGNMTFNWRFRRQSISRTTHK